MTDLAPPVEAPVSARRARTRERLMTAAAAVFAERGIAGASVEEICEAAGFTRGAFYSNFADRDTLVLALIEQRAAEQFAAAERAVDHMKSAPSDLGQAELVSRVVSGFEVAGRSGRESSLVAEELLLHAARQPSLRRPYQEFLDACTQEATALVTDALDYAGLELTVPAGDGVQLLMAAHGHMHTQALFTGRLDPHLLQTLLSAITRPRAD